MHCVSVSSSSTDAINSNVVSFVSTQMVVQFSPVPATIKVAAALPQSRSNGSAGIMADADPLLAAPGSTSAPASTAIVSFLSFRQIGLVGRDAEADLRLVHQLARGIQQLIRRPSPPCRLLLGPAQSFGSLRHNIEIGSPKVEIVLARPPKIGLEAKLRVAFPAELASKHRSSSRTDRRSHGAGHDSADDGASEGSGSQRRRHLEIQLAVELHRSRLLTRWHEHSTERQLRVAEHLILLADVLVHEQQHHIRTSRCHVQGNGQDQLLSAQGRHAVFRLIEAPLRGASCHVDWQGQRIAVFGPVDGVGRQPGNHVKIPGSARQHLLPQVFFWLEASNALQLQHQLAQEAVLDKIAAVPAQRERRRVGAQRRAQFVLLLLRRDEFRGAIPRQHAHRRALLRRHVRLEALAGAEDGCVEIEGSVLRHRRYFAGRSFGGRTKRVRHLRHRGQPGRQQRHPHVHGKWQQCSWVLALEWGGGGQKSVALCQPGEEIQRCMRQFRIDDSPLLPLRRFSCVHMNTGPSSALTRCEEGGLLSTHRTAPKSTAVSVEHNDESGSLEESDARRQEEVEVNQGDSHVTCWRLGGSAAAPRCCGLPADFSCT
eukprot:scaffold317_cov260-Pinguiococcus_pyrenoidosus.AAC.29